MKLRTVRLHFPKSGLTGVPFFRPPQPLLPLLLRPMMQLLPLLPPLLLLPMLLHTPPVVAGPQTAAPSQQIRQELAALERLRGRFSFIVLGDNRSGDDVYRRIVALAAKYQPDLVLNTGDMIDLPGRRDRWEMFWQISRPITVPYFLTVGNHDVDPGAPGSENVYRAAVDLPGNELYYSFVAGNARFIVLDSVIAGEEKRIIGEQLKWLELILRPSESKHRFVFIHHPLYTAPGRGRHAGDCLDRYPEDRDRLQSLFRQAKVEVVFAGHEHYYRRTKVGGITHVITGGAGAPLYENERRGGFHHFIQVTVDGERVSAKVVDISGRVRDTF